MAIELMAVNINLVAFSAFTIVGQAFRDVRADGVRRR
jgi:hypothetical protein